MKMKYAFLGGGKMAEGIIQAMLRGGTASAEDIAVAEKVPERAKYLQKTYGVAIAESSAAAKAPVVFVAVRPQDAAALAQEVKKVLTAKQLLVSIMAGKSLSAVSKLFGTAVRKVRVMPNLALRAGEGMCAVCAAKNATPADVRKVVKILSAAGQCEVLTEKHFDAVTALSGSGPAFFAFMEEAMALGGEALGLSSAAARKLAEQTMLGTAMYLRQSRANLAEFIAAVSSPGGTTAAGMDVMRASDFRKVVAATLKAAAKRSAELGK